LLAVHDAALAQAKAAAPAPGIVKLRIVSDRYVVLDQHPLVMSKDDKQGKITWELPGGSSPWRFDNDAVAIDGSQFIGCRPDAQRLKFTCVNKSPRTAKLYPYRISVYRQGATRRRSSDWRSERTRSLRRRARSAVQGWRRAIRSPQRPTATLRSPTSREAPRTQVLFSIFACSITRRHLATSDASRRLSSSGVLARAVTPAAASFLAHVR
jgi:hypothetical protein